MKRKLFAIIACMSALGLLGLAGSSRADTITGNLQVGGFQPANLYDPNNVLVPATVPTSAYAGFSNASSPTVTVTSFPITFGFNASSISDFLSLDVTTFTATSLTYQETPNNGEQALRMLTFTASPGFFNSFSVTSDNFNNGGITDTVSADGSMVTLNWTGGLVSMGVTNTFAATFAGTSVPSVPLPAALPLFATGLGALGLLGWRRKRKAA